MVKTRVIRHSPQRLFVTSETYVARISRLMMHFFLRKHIYFHGNDIIFKGHVMHKTVIIVSIFNVPLQTKIAFLGPLK